MNNLNFSQKGISLIEILIALSISIIIILAMLRAFVVMGKVTAESSLGANTDGSLMLGLVTVDRVLQGIGYDSASSMLYGSNIGVLDTDGNLLSKGIGGSIFVWKNTDTTCKAFIYETSGLNLYGGSSGYTCTNIAKPADTVSKEVLVKTNSNAIKNNDNKIGEIEFKVLDVSNCVPFGIVNPSITGITGKYQVVMTAYSYAASSESISRPIRNITCLVNLS